MRSAISLLAAGAVLCAAGSAVAATTEKAAPAKAQPAHTQQARPQPAQAQPAKSTPAKAEAAKTEPVKTELAKAEATAKPEHGASDKAAEIVTQPVRDVGLARKEIPAPLVKATEDPYSLTGLKNCRQIAAAVTELNETLGPDFDGVAEYRENRMAKLAEAGGKTVVNSLIPFRSLVREVSGAAPADRRMRAAINAGFARRGYLRGVHASRGCRTKI